MKRIYNYMYWLSISEVAFFELLEFFWGFSTVFHAQTYKFIRKLCPDSFLEKCKPRFEFRVPVFYLAIREVSRVSRSQLKLYMKSKT